MKWQLKEKDNVVRFPDWPGALEVNLKYEEECFDYWHCGKQGESDSMDQSSLFTNLMCNEAAPPLLRCSWMFFWNIRLEVFFFWKCANLLTQPGWKEAVKYSCYRRAGGWEPPSGKSVPSCNGNIDNQVSPPHQIDSAPKPTICYHPRCEHFSMI